MTDEINKRGMKMEIKFDIQLPRVVIISAYRTNKRKIEVTANCSRQKSDTQRENTLSM